MKEDEMKYQMISIDRLNEHPENAKWFTDIKKTSESFWEEFKKNIEEIGIIEALVVNENMQVVSGNQRLKACKELGIKKVPCLVIPNDGNKEIAKMISSNVMRRDIDPFDLFKYINWLRKGYNGQTRLSGDEIQKSQENIAKEISKGHEFVATAKPFSELIPEHQKEIEDWYHENHPTQAQLITKVKDYEELETRINELDKSLKNKDAQIKKIEKEWENEKRNIKDEIEKEIQSRAMGDLVKTIDKVKKGSESLATDVSRFIKQIKKMRIENLRGIDAKITRNKLNQLLSEINRLFNYFDKTNLLEGETNE